MTTPEPEPGRISHPVAASPLRPPLAWRILVQGVHLMMTVVFRWKMSVRVEGEPLPPGRAVVSAVNHVGYMEPFLATYLVWRATGHWHRPLAKAPLFRVPVLGFLGWRAGGISVERESKVGRAGAYAAAMEALADGHTVYVAPEGTLTHTGDLLPLRYGAARLALDAGVPMMVVTHFGGQRAWSRAVGFPHRGAHFDVVIDTLDPSPDDDEVTLTAKIEAIMQQRSEELRRDYAQRDTSAPWWPPYAVEVEPSKQGAENIARAKAHVSDVAHTVQQRVLTAAAEHDVDLEARLHTAAASARSAADGARARAEALVELARNGELGEELRHRVDELRQQAAAIVEHLATLRHDVTTPPVTDAPAEHAEPGEDAAV